MGECYFVTVTVVYIFLNMPRSQKKKRSLLVRIEKVDIQYQSVCIWVIYSLREVVRMEVLVY